MMTMTNRNNSFSSSSQLSLLLFCFLFFSFFYHEFQINKLLQQQALSSTSSSSDSDINNQLHFADRKSSESSSTSNLVVGDGDIKNNTRKSKHPKWKLWEEYTTEEERMKVLDDVGVYVSKVGKIMPKYLRKNKNKNSPYRTGVVQVNDCIGNSTTLGLDESHTLCLPAPKPHDCFFISGGIRDDTTMDLAVANQWKCRGIGLDPSIDHTSHLHPLVTFHNIGLNTIDGNDEMLDAKRNNINDWLYASVPGLTSTLGIDYVDILKLDCEGCELGFTRDLLLEDPTFLKSVSQVSIETHASKVFIWTYEQLYYFGLIFVLLEEAGFTLIQANTFGCMRQHEADGCIDKLQNKEWDFPCGPRPFKPSLGLSCHDFLYVHKQQMMERLNS